MEHMDYTFVPQGSVQFCVQGDASYLVAHDIFYAFYYPLPCNMIVVNEDIPQRTESE